MNLEPNESSIDKALCPVSPILKINKLEQIANHAQIHNKLNSALKSQKLQYEPKHFSSNISKTK